MELRGRCLCGSVRLAVETDGQVTACHCGMCRRWGAGPAFSVFAASAPAVEGAEAVAVWRSSDRAERAHCRVCGSGLWWHHLSEDLWTVNAGLFDDPAALTLSDEIYVEEQPRWYALAGERRRLTGAEVAAMFPGGEG